MFAKWVWFALHGFCLLGFLVFFSFLHMCAFGYMGVEGTSSSLVLKLMKQKFNIRQKCRMPTITVIDRSLCARGSTRHFSPGNNAITCTLQIRKMRLREVGAWCAQGDATSKWRCCKSNEGWHDPRACLHQWFCFHWVLEGNTQPWGLKLLQGIF